MENENQPTGKELYELKKQEKSKEQNTQKGSSRFMKVILPLLVIAGGLGVSIWYFASLPPIPQGEIVSKKGIHWHSQLAIYVKGQKIEIPSGIGLEGAVHNPMHTHDASGTLHLEFDGLVLRDDLKLGRFFKVWKKNLLDFGSFVKMTVNGQESSELLNYHMKDGDKIELKYE